MMSVLQCLGFSLVGVCGLRLPAACRILVSRSRVEPKFPALQGGFLTIGPPGMYTHTHTHTHTYLYLFPWSSIDVEKHEFTLIDPSPT